LTDEPKNVSPSDMEQAIEDLNQELASIADGTTQRLDCNPENIEQGLARLVLSLIELLRRLLERQAIRRMEGGTLPEEKIEEMGLALMKLEQKIRELAQQFGLRPEDLNLDLGPLGQLWTDEKK
jgi:Gas vesicle protein K